MKRRVYSLETEYAISHKTSSPDSSQSLTGDSLYKLLETELLHLPHATCDPARNNNRSLRCDDSLVDVCEGYFLANGARLYFDTGHLEWAAPESDNPYRALVYDLASTAQLATAVQVVERNLSDGRPLLLKNNIDYYSNVTYGCHENYSADRSSAQGYNVMQQVVDRLVPFLVTRQVICGTGRVGSSVPPFTGFQLSQRADFTTELQSVKTREDRPIVNMRDEPLADERRYVRLHLIIGDSNMADYPNFLKLGMTGLLLDMIEADAPLPNICLADSLEAIQTVARDLEFDTPLQLDDGGTATALQIQRAYWQAVRTFIQGQHDPMAQRIIALWDTMLTFLERQSSELEYCLDWAIKRRILGDMLEREGIDWDEMNAWEAILARTWDLPLPTLVPRSGWSGWLQNQLDFLEWVEIKRHYRGYQLDMERYGEVRRLAARLRVADTYYHDIDPNHGLYYRLGNAVGLVDDSQDINHAQQHAPSTTRAAVRERAIHLASETNQQIQMDWHSIQVSWTSLTLPDPLSNDTTDLDELLSSDDDDRIEIIVLDVEDIPPSDINKWHT